MHKPHTIEQYKIQQFLDANFAMEHFLVSPLSRMSLLLPKGRMFLSESRLHSTTVPIFWN